jgi:hypothetical protein
VVVMVMHRMRTCHGLGRNRFGTISRSFRVAGSLLYAAGSSLRFGRGLLRLGGRSFGAGSRRVSAVGRIGCALRWVRLAR